VIGVLVTRFHGMLIQFFPAAIHSQENAMIMTNWTINANEKGPIAKRKDGQPSEETTDLAPPAPLALLFFHLKTGI
jgi:hypothetical protein